MKIPRRILHRLSLLGLAAVPVASCRMKPQAMSAGGRPQGLVDAPETRVGTARDLSVRWELAGFVHRLNQRDVDDLQLRYRWAGDANALQTFWRLFSSGEGPTDLRARMLPGWDAPDRVPVDSAVTSVLPMERFGSQRGVDVAIRAEWSNGAGVPRSQTIPLHVELVYDGQRSWISLVSLREAIRW